MAVPFHYDGFVDFVHVIDDFLDFLRIYVLTRWTDYHVVEPSLDVEPSLFVLCGQIVGLQPSVVSKHFTGACRVLVVAKHHVVTLDDDFSLSGLRIYVVQTHGDPPGCPSGRTYLCLFCVCGTD